MIDTLASDELVLCPESFRGHDASHHRLDRSPNLVETEAHFLYQISVNLRGDVAQIILVHLSIVVVQDSVPVLVGTVFLPARQTVGDELVQCWLWLLVRELGGATADRWRFPGTDDRCWVIVAGLQGWVSKGSIIVGDSPLLALCFPRGPSDLSWCRSLGALVFSGKVLADQY